MIRLLLCILGFVSSLLPLFLLRGICELMGRLLLFCARKRRRLILSNLSHCFPDWSPQQLRKMATRSAVRLMEMGILALTSPFFSKWQIRRRFQLEGDWESLLGTRDPIPGSQLLLIPHLTLTESLTFLPLLLDLKKLSKPVGIIYRPFGHRTLENYIKQTRERFGVRLLSRKNGLMEVANILRHDGCAGLLFDQNAGLSGGLTTLCGRVCYSTLLPEILEQNRETTTFFAYAQRTGFWRAKLILEPLKTPAGAITLRMNAWLEEKLHQDPNFRENWLWAHNRWKRYGHEILNLNARKTRLPQTCQFHHWPSLPKSFRIFIRMPNWLGDILMAVPVIRALRQSRADAHITLLCKSSYHSFLLSLEIADEISALPKKNGAYFFKFTGLRRRLPDLEILFTNSWRGDLESFLIGAPLRIALNTTHWHPFLPSRSPVSRSSQRHQSEDWWNMLHHHGLRQPLDRRPLLPRQTETIRQRRIGFFFGANNDGMAKCWSQNGWAHLAGQIFHTYPQAEILLFGLSQDGETAQQIWELNPHPQLLNRTGRTSLVELSGELQSCEAVVAIDSGGMHLANALGVPVVALFGPSNPIKTGPIFDAPVHLVQPKGCPGGGSYPIDNITPIEVFDALQRLLNKSN